MAAKDSLDAPVAIVHSLEDARRVLHTAARLQRRIYIASAAAAGASAGALWFRALAEAAAETAGESLAGAILDCGPYAGPVMEALALGLPLVRFSGPAATAAKLGALAEARGARLIAGDLAAFDTLDRDRLEAELEVWLRSQK